MRNRTWISKIIGKKYPIEHGKKKMLPRTTLFRYISRELMQSTTQKKNLRRGRTEKKTNCARRHNLTHEWTESWWLLQTERQRSWVTIRACMHQWTTSTVRATEQVNTTGPLRGADGRPDKYGGYNEQASTRIHTTTQWHNVGL